MDPHNFIDVPTNGLEEDLAVRFLKANGITTGVTPTEFRPDAKMTRMQMALMLYRYGKVLGLVEDDGIIVPDPDPLPPPPPVITYQWQPPSPEGWHTVEVDPLGGTIKIPAVDNVRVVFPNELVTRGIRLEAPVGFEPNLHIDARHIKVDTRGLSKGQLLLFAIDGDQFDTVWLQGLHGDGTALMDGVKCGAGIRRLVWQDSYVEGLYGGKNTDAPAHDGFTESPQHPDLVQSYGRPIELLQMAHVVFDGRLGGGNKVLQGTINHAELWHCDFAQAQGAPKPDGYDGGAYSEWAVGVGTIECHDTWVLQNNDYISPWHQARNTLGGANPGIRPGGPFDQ